MRSIDLFAGGGGASLGIEWATGTPPFLAVNHDAHAIAMHAANHPKTMHVFEDVLAVDPSQFSGPVDLLWASPDCKEFSRVKGGPLKDRNVRSLAWVVVEWARAVAPRWICLENVPEFEQWGPLTAAGTVDAERRGETFREFCSALRDLGYSVSVNTLTASDYGAGTSRKRLFLVARRDGLPIRWPERAEQAGPSAFDCLDLSTPFPAEKPLSPAILARIERGLQEAPVHVPGRGSYCLIQTGYGERDGQKPRSLDLRKPLGTIVAGGSKHALVLQGIGAPKVRQLTPRELATAQGFPPDYVLMGTKTQQIARIGNSVCPHVAAAVVRALL